MVRDNGCFPQPSPFTVPRCVGVKNVYKESQINRSGLPSHSISQSTSANHTCLVSLHKASAPCGEHIEKEKLTNQKRKFDCSPDLSIVSPESSSHGIEMHHTRLT